MLIYEGTKDNFLSSVEQDTIAVEIENNIYERMHRHTAKNEFRAWENSMEYMYKVLNDQDIPSDAGIAIEYNIPQMSKRVDFLISGYGKKEEASVVLIELKQWDELEAIPGRDGVVQTYTGNAVRQVVHHSANVKHFFTLLGKMFFTSYGKEFFIYHGKQIFTSQGKHLFTRYGKQTLSSAQPCG